VKELHFK